MRWGSPRTVLSDNAITEVKGLNTLSKLKKLALSNNYIRVVPSFEKNFELQVRSTPFATTPSCITANHSLLYWATGDDFAQTQELRLNGNKILSIPDTIHLNPHIKILDLGKNLIKEWRCARTFSPSSCALGSSAVGPQKLTPW